MHVEVHPRLKYVTDRVMLLELKGRDGNCSASYTYNVGESHGWEGASSLYKRHSPEFLPKISSRLLDLGHYEIGMCT